MELSYSKTEFTKILDNPLPVIVLYGDEDRSKGEAIRQMTEAWIDPGFYDFDLEVLDAEVTGIEDILASALALPFGSNVRMVVIRGAQLYKRRERSSDLDRIISAIPSLPHSSALVFRIESDGEPSKTKSAISAKFDNAVKQFGALIQFKPLTETDLVHILQLEAAKYDKIFIEDAAIRLVRAAQGNRIALENELDKVICYAGEKKKITLNMVEETVSFDPEDVIFKLVDSISRQEPDRALNYLRELLLRENKPQAVAGKLLSILLRQYKLLLQAFELSELKIHMSQLKSLPEEVSQKLPAEASIVSMAWKSKELFSTARKIGKQGLVRAFDLIIECDLANKGGEEGSEDTVTNLQLLVLKLCKT